jgi:hypothetical protein
VVRGTWRQGPRKRRPPTGVLGVRICTLLRRSLPEKYHPAYVSPLASLLPYPSLRIPSGALHGASPHHRAYRKSVSGMDATENGTTSLEGLARRLEALERENAELRGKVAALEGSDGRREEVEATRGSEPSEGLEESRISRRRLLGKAGAAAAGLVVAGALTQQDIREANAVNGVFDSNTDTPAALATNTNVGPGVLGKNTFGGVGVRGEGLHGVSGHSDGETGQGVHGINSTAGDGVLGDSEGGAAIRGRSFGPTGVGVHGEHFDSGYGGQFKGGRAQLRLVPSNRTGRPRGGTHSKGELYMDSNAALFVCVKGGTPGRWRKISTTAI